MTKIVQNYQIQNSLTLFSNKEKIQTLLNAYQKSNLGKLDIAVPWKKLIDCLNQKANQKGPQPLIPLKGQLAIMILKPFLKNQSDKQLSDRINSDMHFRIFCGLPLTYNPILPNPKYISRIRSKLSKQINWETLEKTLFNYWSPYIKDKSNILIDATCYETDMRYPTDVKLVWESLEYIKKN